MYEENIFNFMQNISGFYATDVSVQTFRQLMCVPMPFDVTEPFVSHLIDNHVRSHAT
jgi:hypothetical protein